MKFEYTPWLLTVDGILTETLFVMRPFLGLKPTKRFTLLCFYIVRAVHIIKDIYVYLFIS